MPDRSSGVVKEVPDLGLFPLFQSLARVDAVGSTIALAHGRETAVRVLDDELNLRAIIRWFEPDREVTGADVRAWREDYIESRNRPASVPWSRYDDARVSTNRPVAELFPAISSVMVGRDGRIWVRQYDRPRENRGWLSFNAGGEFVCHLARLPGAVWEFGSDHVLLLAETELGIHMVQLYRLHSPTDRPHNAAAPLKKGSLSEDGPDSAPEPTAADSATSSSLAILRISEPALEVPVQGVSRVPSSDRVRETAFLEGLGDLAREVLVDGVGHGVVLGGLTRPAFW